MTSPDLGKQAEGGGGVDRLCGAARDADGRDRVGADHDVDGSGRGGALQEVGRDHLVGLQRVESEGTGMMMEGSARSPSRPSAGLAPGQVLITPGQK